MVIFLVLCCDQIDLEDYQGCFYEDGSEDACKKEADVSTIVTEDIIQYNHRVYIFYITESLGSFRSIKCTPFTRRATRTHALS